MPSVIEMVLTSTWLESIAYGINSAIFSRSFFVLLRRQAQDGLRSSSRLLLFASTFLIVTATVHVILAFLQLLKAFTDSAILSEPLGVDVYLVSNMLLVTNNALYVANAITQELLLIWRLYIILNRKRIVCVLPIIILIGNAVSGYMGVYYFVQNPASEAHPSVTTHPVKAFILAYWISGFFLNAGLTGSISYYIWQASRDIYTINRSDYRSAIRLMIESGVLVTSCALVLTCLYIAGNDAGPISAGVAIQVNTANPLLIVSRLGNRFRDSAGNNTFNLTRPQAPIGVCVDITRSSSVESPADSADTTKSV